MTKNNETMRRFPVHRAVNVRPGHRGRQGHRAGPKPLQQGRRSRQRGDRVDQDGRFANRGGERAQEVFGPPGRCGGRRGKGW